MIVYVGVKPFGAVCIFCVDSRSVGSFGEESMRS